MAKKSLYQRIREIKQKEQYFGKDWERVCIKIEILSIIPHVIRRRLNLGASLGRKHQEICAKYLEDNYADVLEKYQNYQEPEETLPDDAPIWIFWLQGKENMPAVVKACCDSIKRNSLKHPVIFLDKNNVEEYVKIPDYFKEKMQKGIFTVQCMTNILRNCLLSERGGIWCDATLFLTEPLPEFTQFNRSFHYIKPKGSPHGCFPGWNDHFMIGKKGNILNTYLAEAFLEYYKRENAMLEYGVIRRFVIVGYLHIPPLKKVLDEISPNNLNQWYLLLNHHAKKNFNQDEFNEIKKDTHIFKLDWRMKPNNDKNSVYQHILSGKI